jgi:hypothetical protein
MAMRRLSVASSTDQGNGKRRSVRENWRFHTFNDPKVAHRAIPLAQAALL